MTHALTRLAGLTGASAIGVAAYGAHGLKVDDPQRKVAFENANRYHLIHSAVLLACPSQKRPMVTGSLLVVGTLLFSGSCYAYALTGDREMGSFAPVGGVCMMAGWVSFVV